MCRSLRCVLKHIPTIHPIHFYMNPVKWMCRPYFRASAYICWVKLILPSSRGTHAPRISKWNPCALTPGAGRQWEGHDVLRTHGNSPSNPGKSHPYRWISSGCFACSWCSQGCYPQPEVVSTHKERFGRCKPPNLSATYIKYVAFHFSNIFMLTHRTSAVGGVSHAVKRQT